MVKGSGFINPFGGVEQGSTKSTKSKGGSKGSNSRTVSHSNKGEFTSNNRPKSGGHGQDSIGYMETNKIPYEINVEYNNGVRAGNLPTHKQSMFHQGNRHTWFPKTWSEAKIKAAGEHVDSLNKGGRTAGAHYSAIYDGVRVTVIYGKDGSVATIFPSEKQPGGKKK